MGETLRLGWPYGLLEWSCVLIGRPVSWLGWPYVLVGLGYVPVGGTYVWSSNQTIQLNFQMCCKTVVRLVPFVVAAAVVAVAIDAAAVAVAAVAGAAAVSAADAAAAAGTADAVAAAAGVATGVAVAVGNAMAQTNGDLFCACVDNSILQNSKLEPKPQDINTAQTKEHVM